MMDLSLKRSSDAASLSNNPTAKRLLLHRAQTNAETQSDTDLEMIDGFTDTATSESNIVCYGAVSIRFDTLSLH